MDLSRLSLQEELWSRQDTDYQLFNMQLLPLDVQPTVIGVRLPQIRQLAKDVAKAIGDDKEALEAWFKQYNALRSLDPQLRQPENKAKFFYEERLIAGFVVAYSPVAIPDKVKSIRTFVEKMDNWAVCDSFTNTLSPETPEDFKALKNLIKNWLKHLSQAKLDNPYVLRFILVCLLLHFFPNKDYAYSLDIIKAVQYPADTVKMAKAWVLSQYVCQMPEEAMVYLRDVSKDELDLETYALTVRKINDSRCIEQVIKDLAKAYLKERRQG